MFTTQTAELFITFITFLFSYLAIVTGTNMFRAWVACKMGDDTGVMLGFLTPNPLVHIDPIGLCFLFLLNFGWGMVVPINPFAIHAPYRNCKIAAAYLSDTFAHLFFSIIGMVILLLIFDVHIIDVVRYMVMTSNISHLFIANMYPLKSTAVISLGFIAFTFVYLNVVLGILDFIINISHYLFFILSNRFEKTAQYGHYITIGLPIFLILFFSGQLRLFVVNCITSMGFIIVHMMGMIG